MKKRVLSMFMALGAVSDAPARTRASGGGYAGERRHRAAGAAGGNFARRIRTGWNE